jgi:hypothetical protein
MRVREFGNCCGALMIYSLSGTKEADIKKAITRYLINQWLPQFRLFGDLPHLVIAVTNRHQQHQADILKKWGFKGKKFYGIHPPTENAKDLTVWTFIGDIHDFLGPL